MTKTTDQITPLDRETQLVDAKGKLTNQGLDFMLNIRDSALGKNRISDVLSLDSEDILSPLSPQLRVQTTGGEKKVSGAKQIYDSFDGHTITIEGVSDDNPWRLVNGNGVVLKNKDSILFKKHVSATLQYNATDKNWIETGGIATPGEQVMSAAESINVPEPPSALTRIKSTGGAQPLTSDPQILPSTDGRQLTIEGLSDVDTITIVNGQGVVLKSGSIEFKNNVTAMFHFTQTKALWLQI